MNEQLITRIAKESGLVQGPWANGAKERIWQENRDFPDALEMFAGTIIKECLSVIAERKNIAIDEDWNVDEAMTVAMQEIEEKFGVSDDD